MSLPQAYRIASRPIQSSFSGCTCLGVLLPIMSVGLAKVANAAALTVLLRVMRALSLSGRCCKHVGTRRRLQHAQSAPALVVERSRLSCPAAHQQVQTSEILKSCVQVDITQRMQVRPETIRLLGTYEVCSQRVPRLAWHFDADVVTSLWIAAPMLVLTPKHCMLIVLIA